VLISASFFVAGISAWYLVKGRAKGFARRSMSIALGIATLLMPVQLYLGDNVAGHELPYQLSKLEAIEGNWDSGDTVLNHCAPVARPSPGRQESAERIKPPAAPEQGVRPIPGRSVGWGR
jgi:cytochrome bd-type quinol oxidase subunit 1